MPVIQVNDQQFALHQGPTRIGTGAGVDVRVPGDESLGVQAIVEMGPDAGVIIRRANAAASVKVNGVPLGAEPTPLIHGDKVDVAGTELRFADDRNAGATEFVSTRIFADAVPLRTGTPRATAATGGRLVSLVDGKEYAIPTGGVIIGRDATSDVVVAQSEVSRRHAGIVPSENGYLLQDYSTNGIFVNGARVNEPRLLARADVLRVGTEEFRFYADVAAAAPAGAPAAAPDRAAPDGAVAASTSSAKTAEAKAGTAPPNVASPAAPSSGADALPAAPAAGSTAPDTATTSPRPSVEPPTAPQREARPVLASLEVVNEGADKGKRYDIRVPLAHVGRGIHNEVVIADDSVSDAHATLQRRDDGWYVADLGSTNGTYVGGTRVTGERRLEGAPDVRFGGVKVVFRAARGAAGSGAPDESRGTRPIAPVTREARKPAPRAREVTAPARPVRQSASVSVWVWVAAAVVVIAGILYALKA